jgi:hypothetical protein
MLISQREKNMVLLAVLVVGFALFYWFAFIPIKDNWIQISRQTAQLSGKIERARYLQSHPGMGGYSNNTIENQTITTAKFLEKVETIASEANVTVTSIRPGSVVNKGSVSELSFEIELSGNIAGIAGFVKSIEAPETIARINKLRISRANEEEGTLLNAQISISVLCLPDPQKAGAKKAKTAGGIE